MTQVNLLPPEIRERQKTRRITAAVIAAAGGVVVLLGFVFILQTARLTAAEDELALQVFENEGLTTQIADLQRFEVLKQQVANREALVAQVMQDQVLWSGVLHDVSMVIPGELYLTTLTGTVSTTVVPVAGTVATPEAGGTTIVGSIQFAGVTFEHPTVALWLTRLEEVTGWVNAWVSDSTRTTVEDTAAVQFNGTVDLTVDATTDRIPQ